MKRILILADMEGCNGVSNLADYMDCKNKMIKDVDSIISTIYTISTKFEVSLVDCHNTGETLHEYAKSKKISFYKQLWTIPNVSDYDFAFLIGFHPPKGKPGRLPHTIRPDIERLLLGSVPIGEVTLLINWLSYYGVNVVFITGDMSIRDELIGYPCEFLATHEKNSGSTAELTKHMRTALFKKYEVPKYNDLEIFLELVNSKYLDFLPKELFSINNNRVCYHDTKTFVDELPILCTFLNVCESFQSWRMHYISRYIQKNKLCASDSPLLHNLLCNKEWRALSDEDIASIYSEISRRVTKDA